MRCTEGDVLGQAGAAETVAAECYDRVGEGVETDGAAIGAPLLLGGPPPLARAVAHGHYSCLGTTSGGIDVASVCAAVGGSNILD